MEILEQRYFFSRKTFQLLPHKIKITESSLFHDKEWEVKYIDLGLEVIKSKSREGIGNAVLFGGLLIVSSHLTYKAFTDGSDIKLAWLFVFFCFMWGTVLSWTLQKYFSAYYRLTGGNKSLEFFLNSPTNKEVVLFIDKVKFLVIEKLKEEYTNYDPDSTFEDQIAHLKYLKSMEVLTKEEFESIREELRERHLLKRL